MVPSSPAAGDPAFLRTVEAYAATPFVEGNRLDVLLNGDQLFPALLAAIRSARHTITHAQYSWQEGRIGAALADALAERCRAGVVVTVLLDGFGTVRMPDAHLTTLQRSGCRVATFHPLADLLDLNERNHQRILVVDGRTAFTGGWGVGQRWTGDGREAEHWRDTDVRVEGPIVGLLQGLFIRAWMEATGEVLIGEPYLPRLHRRGPVAIQMVASDPSHGNSAVRTVLLLAIGAARRTLCITTPYFVPDEGVLEALVHAVERGVRVSLLVAGPIDWNIARAAGRHDYGRLLEAGIEVYEYQAGLLHAKTMVVDGRLASIGSANLDMRSLAINREVNLLIHDEQVAHRLADIFRDDLALARRLDLPSWRARPVWRRLFELLTLPLRDLL
jgi:cardiolipin synthase